MNMLDQNCVHLVCNKYLILLRQKESGILATFKHTTSSSVQRGNQGEPQRIVHLFFVLVFNFFCKKPPAGMQ